MKSADITILIAIIAFLLIGGGAWWYLSIDQNRAQLRVAFTKDLEFDSDAWKNGDEVLRGRMVWDLLHRGELHLMTRGELLDLLGEPDRRVNNDSQWYYKVDYSQSASPKSGTTIGLNFSQRPAPDSTDPLFSLIY